MDILEFEDRLREKVRERGHATAEDIESVDEQLTKMPESAALWILRGNLILLTQEHADYSLTDALDSYRTAVERAPRDPQAYEEIGHYLDAVEDKPAEAEAYFRKAIELGGGESAHGGLAEVLAQLNDSE